MKEGNLAQEATKLFLTASDGQVGMCQLYIESIYLKRLLAPPRLHTIDISSPITHLLHLGSERMVRLSVRVRSKLVLVGERLMWVVRAV